MAGEALATVGAGMADISEGQSTAGAPKEPPINTGANPNGSGDTVVPKEDPAAVAAAAKAAEEAAAKAKTDEVVTTPKEEEAPIVVEYADWEDPSAQAAVDLLKESGVSPVEARAIFEKAAASGDTRDIDVKALEAKVGKSKALLIMNGVTDYHRRTSEKNNEAVSAVKEVFGGDKGWDTVVAWAQAKEAVDPKFKKELDGIREDFNKGGRAAKAAAKDLLGIYNGDGNTKGLGIANIVKGEAKVAANTSPLTRAQYNTELKAAHAAGASGPVLAQLDARRRAGMQAGI